MNAHGELRADAIHRAARHALGWLVVGNLAGLWLSLCLQWPGLGEGGWTYGRWVPVHLNIQLYGWTSLPLVAWLMWFYEVGNSHVQKWTGTVLWAWSGALAAGCLSWLNGHTSGKIFLDWTGGARVAFITAQGGLWLLLAMAWWDGRARWNRLRKWSSMLALIGLATVPVALCYASDPSVYPPVDRTTGGPTGASLLASTLVVVGLLLALPRAGRFADGHGRAGRGTWIFFGTSWLIAAVVEQVGGTHFDWWQIGSMMLLLPWLWLLPGDWSGFCWPRRSVVWRRAMFGWWAALVLTGLCMYQPGVLDHIKFTQALVGHSHLAMAGFTTAFCLHVLSMLDRPLAGGRRAAWLWNFAAAVMILALMTAGWMEGNGNSWMNGGVAWREAALALRTACGLVMTGLSIMWFANTFRRDAREGLNP